MNKTLTLAGSLQVGDHIKIAGTMVKITGVQSWVTTVDLEFDDDTNNRWNYRDQKLSLPSEFPVIVWR